MKYASSTDRFLFLSSYFKRNGSDNSDSQVIKPRLTERCLNQGLYADVHFLLDDGSCPAHRALLMARCDVMDAMFAGDFRESSAKVVSYYIYAIKDISRNISDHFRSRCLA